MKWLAIYAGLAVIGTIIAKVILTLVETEVSTLPFVIIFVVGGLVQGTFYELEKRINYRQLSKEKGKDL